MTNPTPIRRRFDDLRAAEGAIQDLLDMHVPPRAIRVEACSEGRRIERSLRARTHVTIGALSGAGLGALVAVVGLTAAVTGQVAASPVMIVGLSMIAGLIAGTFTGMLRVRYTAVSRNELDDESDVWVTVEHETLARRAATVLDAAGGMRTEHPTFA